MTLDWELKHELDRRLAQYHTDGITIPEEEANRRIAELLKLLNAK